MPNDVKTYERNVQGGSAGFSLGGQCPLAA